LDKINLLNKDPSLLFQLTIIQAIQCILRACLICMKRSVRSRSWGHKKYSYKPTARYRRQKQSWWGGHEQGLNVFRPINTSSPLMWVLNRWFCLQAFKALYGFSVDSIAWDHMKTHVKGCSGGATIYLKKVSAIHFSSHLPGQVASANCSTKSTAFHLGPQNYWHQKGQKTGFQISFDACTY